MELVACPGCARSYSRRRYMRWYRQAAFCAEHPARCAGCVRDVCDDECRPPEPQEPSEPSEPPKPSRKRKRGADIRAFLVRPDAQPDTRPDARPDTRPDARPDVDWALLAEGVEVDHIDQDTTNNKPENLAPLTKKDHDTKTKKQSRRSSGPKQSKPIRGRPKGSEKEWTHYLSASDAARKLGVHRGNISACCQGKQPTAGGYVWEFVEIPDLPDEEWRDIPENYFKGNMCSQRGTRARASNKGRVETVQGVKTNGSLNNTKYHSVKIMGKLYLVSRLVTAAWKAPAIDEACRRWHDAHGTRYSLDPWLDGRIQVDHVDEDTTNNTPENLTPLTPKEHNIKTKKQKGRRSSAPAMSKPVRGRPKGEKEWTEYPSAHDAARKLGVNQGGISNCCRGKQPTAGGYVWEFVEIPDLPDEEWRDIPEKFFKGKMRSKRGTRARASSKGRVQTVKGVKTEGYLNSKYRQVGIMGKLYLVSRLVAATWNTAAFEAACLA